MTNKTTTTPKEKGGILRRAAALALCACLALPAASCSHGGMSEAEIAAKREEKRVKLENVFATTYLDMPEQKDYTFYNIDDVVERAGKTYLLGYYGKESEDENGDYRYENGTVISELDPETKKTKQLSIFPTGKYEDTETTYTSENMQYLNIANDGSLWYVLGKYFSDYTDPDNAIYTQEFLVQHTDITTETLYSSLDITDLLPEENKYLRYLEYDEANDQIIAVSPTKLLIISSEGELVDSIDLDIGADDENHSTNIENMFINPEGDAVLYIVNYDYSGNRFSMTRSFKKLNLKTGKLEDYADIDDESGNLYMYNIYPSKDGSAVYFTDQNGVNSFDLKTQEMKQVLNFINSDLNGNRVSVLGVYGDNGFIAQEYTSDYNETRLALLEKVSEDDIVEKYTLDFASIYLNSNVRDAIIDFNKQQTDFRINVIDYSQYNTDDDPDAAVTKLNQDIIQGNIPDLFDASSLPLQNYISKSLIADLSQRMDEDSTFDRSLYLENILNITAEDGKIYSIIPSFALYALVGDADDFGGKAKLSADDLLALLKKYPDATMMPYYVTREDVLTGYTGGEAILSAFAAANDGRGDFASGEYAKVLELIKNFPAEFDWDEYYSDPQNQIDETTMYIDKRVLLEYSYIGSFSGSYLKREHGPNYAFAGIPTPDDSSGVLIAPSSEFAVSAKSVMQDEAWQFIKYLLSEDYQKLTYNFPIMKSVLESQAQEVLDANAERKKQDEKNPDEYGVPEIMQEYGDDGLVETVEPEAGDLDDADTDDEVETDTDEEAVDDTDSDTGTGTENVVVRAGLGTAVNMVYTTESSVYGEVYIEQEDIDKVMALIHAADGVIRGDTEIKKIVEEESGAFFSGKKTAQDCANIIQSRVMMYVDEGR